MLVGCSGDDETAGPSKTSSVGSGGYAIEISDLADKVSSNPADKLFRFRLSKGDSLEAAELSITVQFGTGTTYALKQLQLEDTNGNNKLDVGETMVVSEGSVNTISEAYVGQDGHVTLLRFGQGDPTDGATIATAIWRLNN